MKPTALLLALLAAVFLPALSGQAGGPACPKAPDKAPLVPPLIPERLGVNIHFADSRGHERDIDLLAQLGVRWIRMDLAWAGVERERGRYNLDGYLRLTDALAAKGIRCLYILDYGNPLYEGGLPPKTPEGIAAFARFAGAAAEQLKGRRVMYELWNEPNLGHFWKPAPDPAAYMVLMRPTVAAVRAADPDAAIVGPATSTIDLPFLETVFQAGFKAGFLDLVDGVTVHPYRSGPPETVAEEYGRLRALIARYAAPGRVVPVLSGEWGYTSANVTADQQADRLARQWLINALHDVQLSIWYDWKNDGPDPKEPEHRFGILTEDLKPKPAFEAAKRLIAELSGLQAVKRLSVGDPAEDYVLLFVAPDGTRQKLAAWTLSEAARRVDLSRWGGGTAQSLTQSPVYLPAKGTAAGLEAAWSVEVPQGVEAGPSPAAHLQPEVRVTVSNPTSKLVEFLLSPQEWDGPARFTLKPRQTVTRRRKEKITLRSEEPYPVPVTLRAPSLGWQSTQTPSLWITNPLRLRLFPGGGGLNVVVEGTGLDRLSAHLSGDFGRVEARPLESGKAFWPMKLGSAYTAGAVVRQGGALVAQAPVTRFVPVPLDGFSGSASAYRVSLDGDSKVDAHATLTVGTVGPDAQFPKAGVVRYDFGEGWRFLRVEPIRPMAISGRPRAAGFWLWTGEGSRGDFIRVRFRDSTNQTFQPSLREPVSQTGWRWVTLPMDGRDAGSWGGAQDSIVHYPIAWDALLLVDSHRKAHTGEVRFAGLTLLY
jgi:polysaccharide biosynthesis protein PslG